MPTSVESIETKEKAYEQFQNTYDTLRGTGPTYIVGDFNARLIYPGNSTEEEVMGKFTMFDNKEEMRRLREPMLENRELLVQFTLANELRIINSMFKKHIGKLATYRIDKTTDIEEEILTNEKHAQIDFILTEHRWRNIIINAETQTRANINTDRYPLIFETRIKLKKVLKG